MRTSVTEYHIPARLKEDGSCLRTCDGCNHTFEEGDMKRSKMLGEWLCARGEGSCWNEARETHKEQNRIFGYSASEFE